jgi:hypothetical protein
MKPKSPETEMEMDLAALADGNLPAERIDEVEGIVLASPEHTRRLAEQRRVSALLGATDAVAPPSLHHAIATQAGGRRARRVPSPRWSLAGVGALAAAAVVAVVLALGSGTAELPTVTQASRLGLRAATVASPAENPSNHALLASSVDGIAYPYWGKRFGWKTDGARSDRLGARTITTVFYKNARAQRIGYSIVAGEALALPAGRAVKRAGVSFRVLNAGGVTVVTWRRDGHTCILSARAVSSSTLLALASWQRS